MLVTNMVVYGLHAGDGVVRYVGQTRSGLRKRMYSHGAYARREKTGPAVYGWIRKHGFENIEVIVLGIPANQEEMDELERTEIAARWDTGLLLNHERGGLHGKPMPREWRNKPEMCKRRHLMEGENILWAGAGRRCRACVREKERVRALTRPRPPRKRDDPNWSDPKSRLTIEQKERALQLYDDGARQREVAAILGVPEHVIHWLVRKNRGSKPARKLTEDDVRSMILYRRAGVSLREIGLLYEVGESHVWRIVNGVAWRKTTEQFAGTEMGVQK